MKHIWDAIELCHRKLLNERERISSAAADAAVAPASRGGAATVDRTSELLEEIDRQLKEVAEARGAYNDQYGEPSSEAPAEPAG